MVRTHCFHCWGLGFYPWSPGGGISRVVQSKKKALLGSWGHISKRWGEKRKERRKKEERKLRGKDWILSNGGRREKNSLDWAPTVHCSAPKFCQSHPSPEEQCLLYLCHRGATQGGHTLSHSPDGLPRPWRPALSLPAPPSDSERREGRVRLRGNCRPR